MKVSLASIHSQSAPKADLFVAGFFKGEKDLKTLRKIDPVHSRNPTDAAIANKEVFRGNRAKFFSAYQTGYRQAPEMALSRGLGEKKSVTASLR